MTIQKIITNNANYFENWTIKLNRQIKAAFDFNEITDNESIEIVKETNQLLIDMTDIFFLMESLKIAGILQNIIYIHLDNKLY